MSPSRPLLLLAIPLLLAVASPERARAEACLAGDAVDQRSITELRAAAEGACPCASYDGSVGARRSDYDACVADVLERAIADGDLREECREIGAATLADATCGTRRVACGRIAPEGDPVFSCRIAPEASCRSSTGGTRRLPTTPAGGSMSGRIRIHAPGSSASYAEHACTSLSHCDDVVDWTASTCFDVREPGPYGAGARELILTRPSSVDGEPRTFETAVWYPTTPGAGDPDPAFRAVRDAPVDLSGGPYPVVVFSHGSCGFERQSLFLTPWLASHGFIVVAPRHVGNTLFEFPQCRVDVARWAVERPDDVLFALDDVLARNADSASPFFGALDPERIAMTGHSFGGLTTFLTTMRDGRFKVAVPMAAAAPPQGALTIPSMTLIGEVDSVVDNESNIAAFERSRAPKWLVSIRSTGHYAFSDGCFPSADCEPPLVLTQEEAHERVKRWVLPFLKVYLEGDPSFVPFLAEEAGPSFSVRVS